MKSIQTDNLSENPNTMLSKYQSSIPGSPQPLSISAPIATAGLLWDLSLFSREQSRIKAHSEGHTVLLHTSRAPLFTEGARCLPFPFPVGKAPGH